MNNKIKSMQDSLEQAFEDLNFAKQIIEGSKNYCYKGCYYQLTYIKEFNGFVIEYAENLLDAQNGVYEDGDIIKVSESVEDMKQQLKKYLELYYMD